MAKVLIIEDDVLMVHLYEKILKKAGHEVISAEDGVQGLEKLGSMKPAPNLIMLDIMMPRLNGFQVLEKIKKDEALKDIPVIMLTNLAGGEDAKRALELGAKAYMIKSEYEPNQVAEKVKEILDA